MLHGIELIDLMNFSYSDKEKRLKQFIGLRIQNAGLLNREIESQSKLLDELCEREGSLMK